MHRSGFAYLAVAILAASSAVFGVEPQPLPVKDSAAKTAAEMKPYVELIEHTEEKFALVPIPGGKFIMGSPTREPGRKPEEGPQHEVEIDPFWMSSCEIPWDVYEIWAADIDIIRRQVLGVEASERDAAAEPLTISKPTKPYTDMTFGMGKRGYPAISMTQHSARVFCQWLSAKTGRYYRLPTEAEWEYACRAGTTTAYSFGDDPTQLGDYAWYKENAKEKYQKIGQKKPNPWGLYDMHGNVAEWVLDQNVKGFYVQPAGTIAKNPLAIPTEEYNRVVRGGSWDDNPDRLRSAARRFSDEGWKEQDPQEPQSIWYLTDAKFLGIRVVRPLHEPSAEEKAYKWEKNDPPQLDRAEREKLTE